MIAIIAAYAADGRPIWFFFGVNPFRTYNNFDVRQELCRGPVYEPRGPWFGAPYVGDAFNLGELVGSIELEGSTTLDGDFPFTGFTVRYAIRGFNRQVGLGRFNYQRFGAASLAYTLHASREACICPSSGTRNDFVEQAE